MRIDKRFACFALLLACPFLSLSAADSSLPGSGSPSALSLFFIERSKNANEVHYAARLDGNGLLDPQKPVCAFWINWKEDPTGNNREALNLLEKRMAFGFSVDREKSPQSCVIKLVCCPDRPIRIFMDDGVARAETAINAKPAHLRKISVVTRESKLMPQVISVTVSGTDKETGEEITETITPR